MPSLPYPALNPEGRHCAYALEPRVLLVFKPRGHRETMHAHPAAQRLTVLTGALRVEFPRTAKIITRKSTPFAIAANRSHATVALQATWLLVEKPPHKGRSKAP